MKAEELLKKIKRLEDIAICSMFPTVLGTGTSLTKWDEDWFKRTDRYKINLINQFKKDIIEDCKNELLKQILLMRNQNNYPFDAVPKTIILELPALMQQITKK